VPQRAERAPPSGHFSDRHSKGAAAAEMELGPVMAAPPETGDGTARQSLARRRMRVDSGRRHEGAAGGSYVSGHWGCELQEQLQRCRWRTHCGRRVQGEEGVEATTTQGEGGGGNGGATMRHGRQRQRGGGGCRSPTAATGGKLARGVGSRAQGRTTGNLRTVGTGR
jgi:hypothetical protein